MIEHGLIEYVDVEEEDTIMVEMHLEAFERAKTAYITARKARKKELYSSSNQEGTNMGGGGASGAVDGKQGGGISGSKHTGKSPSYSNTYTHCEIHASMILGNVMSCCLAFFFSFFFFFSFCFCLAVYFFGFLLVFGVFILDICKKSQGGLECLQKEGKL